MLLVLLRLAVLLGVPVLLLIFLGTAGITSIIEAVVSNPEARTHITEIIYIIVQDGRLRRTTSQMKGCEEGTARGGAGGAVQGGGRAQGVPGLGKNQAWTRPARSE